MRKISTHEDITQGLNYLTGRDHDLHRALETVNAAGVEVPLRLRPGGFTGMAQIVISQLVSKASASAINQRFDDLIFPCTPRQYLDAGEEVWREIGLSRPKQKTLTALANALLSGALDLDSLADFTAEQAHNKLTAIHGIGPWSAQVYLLFCLGHADIFPSGDLALREAARMIWQLNERPGAKQLDIQSQQWTPWRGVAARLFWALYAVNKAGREGYP